MSLGYITGELFTVADAERAAAHFTQYGHVAFDGLYDPALAPAAISQIRGNGLVYLPRSVREQTALVTYDEVKPGRPELDELLTGMNTGALAVGRSVLLPADTKGTTAMQIIEMQPGAEGTDHQDRKGLPDTVGITTLAGTSLLRLRESGIEYSLQAGAAVFLDNNRRPWHQGVAAGPGPRTGLVVFSPRFGSSS